jgi:hypothetical protein
MITVKKYSTLKELKASEERTADTAKIKERHAEFEKVMRSIYAEITARKSKQSY